MQVIMSLSPLNTEVCVNDIFPVNTAEEGEEEKDRHISESESDLLYATL